MFSVLWQKLIFERRLRKAHVQHLNRVVAYRDCAVFFLLTFRVRAWTEKATEKRGVAIVKLARRAETRREERQ